MKIRKITFSNINNLKGGPHVVDFSIEPLASSGIFAIVGPTGSGKSTLLDVITLALFNEVPRHGKLSKNSIIDSGSIVTHNARSAFAKVEFEVRGQVFTSSWEIETTKKGNLKDYHMSISDINGNFLDLKRSEVPSKNMSLIGLNYDQFVKSIILSQGEFSRFLKARKEERSELLEKLTGTEIYREISKGAFQKNKDVTLQLNNERALLSEIDLLKDEELAELHSKRKTQEEKATLIEKEVEALQKLKTSKERQASVQNSLELRRQELIKLKESTAALNDDYKKLERHDKVKSHEAALLLFEEAEKSVRNYEKEIGELELRLLKAIDARNTSVERLADLRQREVSQEEFLGVLEQYESEIIEIDQQMRNLLSLGKQSRNELLSLQEDSGIAIGGNEETQKTIIELEREANVLADQTDGKEEREESIAEKIETIRSNLEILRNLLFIQKALNQNKDEVLEKQKLEEKERERMQNLAPLINQQSKLIDALKSKLLLLSKKREDAIKIANLETLRDQLVDGSACPLCGSTEHPYTQHLEESEREKIEEEVDAATSDLQKEESLLLQYTDKRKEYAMSISNLKARRNELAGHISKDEEVLGKEEKKLQGNFKIDGTLSESIDRLDTELSGNEAGLKAFRRLKIVNRLIKKLKELQNIRLKYSQLQSQRKGLYSGDRFNEEIQSLRTTFIQSRSKIEQLKEQIHLRTRSLEEGRRKVAKGEEKMTDVLKNLNLPNIQALKNLILSEVEATNIRERKNTIRESLIKVEAEIDQLIKEAKTLNVKDDESELSLEEVRDGIRMKSQERDSIKVELGEIKSLLRTDEENRKKQSNRRLKIQNLEKEARKWSLMNKMIGSSKGDSFANFAQELTLKNLLVFANRRLKNLSDRYLLDMPKDGGALVVIDLYQGNTERSVTTLSGGEIFILSLALALSLSDMASKNIGLESLFIDEGFGTLDQETLDIAMTTLEKLQSESKKTVGIISHVEALKERINVQIRLQKNAQGYSKIKVIS